MSPEAIDEKAVFNIARRIDSREARADYLQQACGADSDALRRVVELLQVHEQEQSFLESPAVAVQATIDQPPLEQPGTVIGPYKLLQQIGEGGMGTVYMAEQSHPVQRMVALKVIKAGMDSQQVIARFEAERQALALMDHPNIAKVLDAGTTAAGRPYFVMELVKGVPITTYCDENHLPPKARLELFTQVCQAVQHAHHKGVIHRDLKPNNVLVTLYDDKPVPKVIDFGVAKATGGRLTERTMFTGYGQIVGTVEYMSPEQARLNALDVDTRGDIYSLGVLLYELLTGTTPFDKKRLREAAFDEMLRMIREDEPPKPSTRLSTTEARASIAVNRGMEPNKLSGLVRGELDWIVMKALEKDRNRRYETANGFAADVQRYLNDESVQACPPSASYRLRKLVRRNKVALATTAVVAAALVLGTLVSTWQAVRATRAEGLAQTRLEAESEARSDAETARTEEAAQRAVADRRRIEADEQRVEAQRQGQIAHDERDRTRDAELVARRQLYAARMNLVQRDWEKRELGRMLELLESERPTPGREDLRSFEWYYLWRLCHSGLLSTLRGHKGTVFSVAFSPDGNTLVSGSGDATVKLWDTASGKHRTTLRGHTAGVASVAFAPDGLVLASASADTTVKLWNAATHEEMATLRGHAIPVRSVAFSADSKMLATGAGGYYPRRSGEVKLWDVGTQKEQMTLNMGTEVVTCVAFSPDGETLAAATEAANVKLLDIVTGQAKRTLVLAGAIGSVAFSPDGKTLAVAGDDNEYGGQDLTLWDVETGQKQNTLTGQTRVLAVAFGPDGTMLASAGRNKTVNLRDLTTSEVRTMGHTGQVRSIAFSRDGETLASGSADGTVKLWRTGASPDQTTLFEHTVGRTLALSADGKILAIGNHDGSVKLWDTVARQERAMLKGHTSTSKIRGLTFSPDRKTLASGSEDGTLSLWDLETAKQRAADLQMPHNLSVLALSPDGETLAAGGFDGLLKLWDTATWHERFTIRASTAGILCLAFSRDGKTLVTSGTGLPDGGVELKLWEVATGRHLLSTEPVPDGVWSVAFAPDGKTAAVGYMGGGVMLWDVGAWREPVALHGHTGAVFHVAFSPDGRTLATASADQTVKLWDVVTRQERLTLSGHTGSVWCLAFSHDGKTLFSQSSDGTVKIWLAATEQEVLAQTANDPVQLPGSGGPDWLMRAEAAVLAQTANDPVQRAVSAHLSQATANGRLNRFQDAISEYKRAHELDSDNVLILNNFAWLLATCPDPKFRDAGRAVELAKKAVELEPNVGGHWNTLGAAHYRAGEWKAAIEALEKSEELSPRQYFSFNAFFVAMAHWQLGDKEQARKWYDQAVEWMEKNQPQDEELKRFRAEAAELLGLKEEEKE